MRIIPRKSCLRVFSRACPFPPRSPSLFSITLSGPSHRLPCLGPPPPLTLAFRLFLPLFPAHPLHQRALPPRRRRGENERAHMYARIIRAAAPRSLIVHRNRNCVPASHACGLPVLCPARPAHLLFVADSPTLPSASFLERSTDPPSVTFGDAKVPLDRQIARLSLSRRAHVIDLSASRCGAYVRYAARCPFISRPLKAPT